MIFVHTCAKDKTMEQSPRYDLITMGRSSIDLYSNDSGAPFVDI